MIFVICLIIGVFIGVAIGCYVLINFYIDLVDSFSEIYNEWIEMKNISDEDIKTEDEMSINIKE